MSRWDLPPEKTLEQLFAEWRDAISIQVDPGTVDMYRLHCGHLVRHFADEPSAITKATISTYTRARLAKVKRKTLQKERCTLRGFLAWAHEQGYLLELPDMGTLPRRALGTPYHLRRRGAATLLTPDDCRRVISLLPQWSPARAGRRPFPVRARFIVAFETALRPKTIDALSVPEHYTLGAEHLVITDEIDKARFGRKLPLSRMAREALDSVAAKVGPIFGCHDYRNHLERAAERALTAEQARTFCAYDLRHARATQLAGKGDLPTLAYLLGHKHVSTTNLYVHPTIARAKALLDEAGGSPTSHSGELVGDRHVGRFTPDDMVTVRRRGLEPPRPYRAPEPESVPDRNSRLSQIGPVREKARVMLRAVKNGGEVSPEQAIDLARDALRLTGIGCLCLDVFDGGPFAASAAVELAWIVVDGDYMERLTALADEHFASRPADYPNGITVAGVRALELATLIVDERARRRKDGER